MEDDVPQIIALVMVLILAGSALIGQRISWTRGLYMALAWVGIFIVVTLVIATVR